MTDIKMTAFEIISYAVFCLKKKKKKNPKSLLFLKTSVRKNVAQVKNK